jgi:hypothetical protein
MQLERSNWQEERKRSRAVEFSNCLDICTCEAVVSNLLCLIAAIYRSHVVYPGIGSTMYDFFLFFIQ